MQNNMFYGANHLIFQRAEELRNNMTSAENIIWKHVHINAWKLKFRRQHPIFMYVVDFYCHALKLVIEIDGGIHDDDEVKKKDEEREATLKNLGLTIIRFRNEEVYTSATAVLKRIDQTIQLIKSKVSEAATPDIAIQTKSLVVVKIGGNIIDDPMELETLLQQFASLNTPLQGMGAARILVHGGGKLATSLASRLGVEQQLVDGRRITDAETLKLVTMVYAGYINKTIVAQLQAAGCNALGLSGADGNLVRGHKRSGTSIDYGFVGDVDAVNVELIDTLLQQGVTLVIAPITHDGAGQLLNTNADTIAQELATAMSSLYDVQLVYSFEKSGVLMNAEDESTVINKLDAPLYTQLKSEQKVFAGMLPKLDNAFAALSAGVKKVIIGKAGQLHQLLTGEAGTTIVP